MQSFAMPRPEIGGAFVVHFNRKTPLELSLAGFSVTPTVNLKAVHFDVTKKSIIFVLIELYSIASLGGLLYGSLGPDRYETYHFVPTFY